jgi:hypothetical protein
MPDKSDIKRIDIAEFRAMGGIQEINRLFLHPLGMALEVVVEDDGSERLGGIWDYRDDPEGIYFEGVDMAAKARAFRDQLAERAPARKAALGYVIQPAETGGQRPFCPACDLGVDACTCTITPAENDELLYEERPADNMRIYRHPGCTQWVVPLDDSLAPSKEECTECAAWLSTRNVTPNEEQHHA